MSLPIGQSSSPLPSQVPNSQQNATSALPGPGQETLEEWVRINHEESLSELTQNLDSSTLDEEEVAEAEKIAKNLFQSFIEPLVTGLVSFPQNVERELDEGNDLFESIGKVAGRITTPLFQSAATQAGLPQDREEGFQYFLDTMQKAFPEMMRNSARTFSPENVSQFDAYTPFSIIGEMGLSCIRQPIENVFVKMSRYYNPDFTRKKTDPPAGIFVWGEEDAKALSENFFRECSAELHLNRNDSIASRRGISHPDTLKGRYQRLPEEEKAKEKGKEREITPAGRDSISPFLPHIQEAGVDVEVIQQEIWKKQEETQRMQCAVAGCRSRAEFEEKEKRLDELKTEATRKLDYKVRLQRDFEQIIAFLDDPHDRLELENLFQQFERTPEAYQDFNRGRDGVNILIAENLLSKFSESMGYIRERLQGTTLSEIPEMRTILLKESIENALNRINELLVAHSLKISDPLEKKGHYFMCKWFQKTGPSMLRLALAEKKPDYKLEQALIGLGHLKTYSKNENNIPLSEFDLKMATLMKNNDGAIDLDTLDLMREMDSKGDEEMIDLLMLREVKDHETFIQTFGRRETASKISVEEGEGEDFYANMPPLDDPDVSSLVNGNRTPPVILEEEEDNYWNMPPLVD